MYDTSNQIRLQKRCIILCCISSRGMTCSILRNHLPILNILVPQVVQMPWVAGLPFFIVTFFSSFISLFDLHLTQYASILMQ